MNKLVIITAVVILVVLVATLYLLLSPRHGETHRETTSSKNETISTTTPTVTETTTPTTITRRECPANGVLLSVSTKLSESRVEGHPYELTISVNVRNELDEAIRLKAVVIDNNSFVWTIVTRLSEAGAEDYIDDFYGLRMIFEDRVIILKSGEYRSIPINLRIPYSVVDLWQINTLHYVEVVYEIDGLTCSFKTDFVIKE